QARRSELRIGDNEVLRETVRAQNVSSVVRIRDRRQRRVQRAHIVQRIECRRQTGGSEIGPVREIRVEARVGSEELGAGQSILTDNARRACSSGSHIDTSEYAVEQFRLAAAARRFEGLEQAVLKDIELVDV